MVIIPPSRCRHVPRWGCWGGLVGLRLPRVRPLRPGLGTSSTPTRDAGLSAARGSLPGGEHLQRWAGLTPPTLLLSDRGRKWGPNPLGSIEQTMEGTSGECASSCQSLWFWQCRRDQALCFLRQMRSTWQGLKAGASLHFFHVPGTHRLAPTPDLPSTTASG